MRFIKQGGNVEEEKRVTTNVGENALFLLIKMTNSLWNDFSDFLKCPYLTKSIFEVIPIKWFSTSCTSIDPIHCRDPTNVAGLSPASTRAFVYLKIQKDPYTRQLLKITFRAFSLITSIYTFFLQNRNKSAPWGRNNY